jgi:uncharacterized protein YndB with AHSA1/START domain
MTKPPDIEVRYYYDASPADVFKALTKPKRLTEWFLDEAKIKPIQGSAYEFSWKGYPSQKGKVEKVLPDRLLVLSWPNTVKRKVYHTKVSFGLAKKGKGTMLEVKHTGFGEGDDWVWLYGAIQAGWAYFLMNLKSVLSEGVDLRSTHDAP